MGQIIDLSDKKLENSPHTEGKASCVLCGHVWHAVVPSGVIWFECPQCATLHGTFVNTVLKDAPHWHCGCGSALFHITPDEVYCPVCGARQVFEKAAPA